MIRDGAGYRAIECNADTSAFIVETHEANAVACVEYGFPNPNGAAPTQMRQALHELITAGIRRRGVSHTEVPHVVFAASGLYPEDMGTAEYLCSLVGEFSQYRVRAGALQTLTLEYDRLLDEDGQAIDVLYRLWPIENFAYDVDVSSGEFLGPDLFRLVAEHRLALINPPSAYLLQSKSVHALIWQLANSGVYFTADERARVFRSFLPTAWDACIDAPYVVKPAMGREGIAVRVVAETQDPTPEQFGPFPIVHPIVEIFQRYLEPARIDVVRSGEKKTLVAVTSCFILNGQPGAVGVRVSEGITDHRASFLPLAERPPQFGTRTQSIY